MKSKIPDGTPWSKAEMAASESRKALASKSLMAFARIYFPHYLEASGCSMHEEICTLLDEATVKREAMIALAGPRGFAKSAYSSLIYPLYCLVFGHEEYIVLVSNTAGQAEDLLGHIKRELKDNVRLRMDFPCVCEPENAKPAPTRWRVDEAVTRSGAKILALPAEGKVRGRRHGRHRPGLIILDDMEHNEQSDSPARCAKLREWLLTEVIPALSPKGNVVVLGTVLARESLMAQLLKPDSGWTARRYQAIRPDGTALWEAVWSLPRLEACRKLMGTPFFLREMQCDPLDPESQIFKSDWRREYSVLPPDLRVFMGVDPAACQSSHSDLFSCVLIGVDAPTWNIYVLEAYLGRLPSLTLQAQKIQELYARYMPYRIGVEAVAYQTMLGQELINRTDLPIKLITPTKDKITRAMELAVPFENGKVWLKPGMQDLWDQLIRFPKGGHDDALDALGHAVSIAREFLRNGPVDVKIEIERGRTLDEILEKSGFSELESLMQDPGKGWRSYDTMTCDLLGLPRGTRTRR